MFDSWFAVVVLEFISSISFSNFEINDFSFSWYVCSNFAIRFLKFSSSKSTFSFCFSILASSIFSLSEISLCSESLFSINCSISAFKLNKIWFATEPSLPFVCSPIIALRFVCLLSKSFIYFLFLFFCFSKSKNSLGLDKSSSSNSLF